MFQIKAKLLYNKRVRGSCFCGIIDAPKIAKKAYPGQFVNVKISPDSDPLLRRPFSIHKVKGSSIKILYEVVGLATRILSEKKAGEYLDIIGPLGKGFSIINSRISILVAGGMGVAPLVFLAEKIKKGKTLVLIGAKTKGQILCEKDFRGLGYEVKIATDDGTKGFRGYASELLEKILRNNKTTKQRTTIYACGPRPMLKAITQISKTYKIPAQISLEEHMACGFGACLGCVVNTKDGFQRVCKEGPVFAADQILQTIDRDGSRARAEPSPKRDTSRLA
jgi:dihydroorotate dehydrogenase electron transfer subunit